MPADNIDMPGADHSVSAAIVTQVFASRTHAGQVRVWVVGCGDGLAAYELAAELLEHAGNLERPPAVQVFATDADEHAIARARRGLYDATIAAILASRSLQRYFTPEGSGYRVRRELRDSLLFAVHHLMDDPPFWRLDLVACRVDLGALEPAAQQQALLLFHHGLQDHGYLWLESAGTIDVAAHGFTPVEWLEGLYLRRALPDAAQGQAGEPAAQEAPARPGSSLDELSERLRAQHGPPSVIIDRDYAVVHVSQGAGRFLTFGEGQPSRNLLGLVHPALRSGLVLALHEASAHDGHADSTPAWVDLDGRPHLVSVGVRPTGEPEQARGQQLIIFRAMELPGELPSPPDVAGGGAAANQLAAELEHLQEQLRFTTEEYETMVEEHKAANEELQVINEEQRATTEELESSKEELQATNEELLTVNQQLTHAVAQLAQRNDDLQNLVNATAIGTLFVDRQLRIMRYTPPALAIFNLTPGDLQRPLAHVTHRLEHERLVADVEQVLKSLEPLEREVHSTAGRWYLAGFQPYHTQDHHVNGVVLTFVDITERKQAEERLRESEARFRTVADAVPHVIWANEADGAATYFNRRWFEYSGLTYEQSVGPGWQAIVHPDDAPASVERWQHALQAGQVFDTEYRLRRADGAYRWHLGRNIPLHDAEGRLAGWFGSATDIDDLKQAEVARRESDERFRLLIEGARDYAMFLLDTDNRITFWSTGAERVFGWSEAEALGQSGGLIFVPEDRANGAMERELDTAIRDGRAADRRWHLRKDGSRLFVDGVLIRLDDEQGNLRGFVKIGRDATEQHRAEDALLRAHDELEQRVAERTIELTRQSMLRQELLLRLVTAQEDERRRIALELHDSLGQYLSALALNLARIQESEGVSPQLRAELSQLRLIATEIDMELDRLAMELRPPMLDDLGLVDALVRYIHDWSAANGIAADVIATGFEQVLLPAPVETTAFRIVQEALTNVHKHAQASQVNVIATRTSEELRILIEDDGVGFDPEYVARSRRGGQQLGLVGMAERAAAAGGTVTIESEPGHGTTIYLRVPTNDQEEGQS